jgi:hypothetical protein
MRGVVRPLTVSKVDCSELSKSSAASRLSGDVGIGRDFFASVLRRIAADLDEMRVLQRTMTKIAEDCDRVNCYISMLATAVDFGK